MSVEKQAVDEEGTHARPAATLLPRSPTNHKRKQTELLEPTMIAQESVESANPAKKKKRIRTEVQKQSTKRRAAELKKGRSLESSADENKKQK